MKVDPRTLSPAEKYDLYGDKNWTLTKWERKRTGILKTVRVLEYVSGHKIPKWFGLCHN